ncbi:MAG: DUF1786 domain-containing protein [Chloroflexi bacterium]|nr:DUF1786 domain-containing protein [Chloroflexota bacterium]
MRILAVDVGTGTQDILLFDSEKEPENNLKMIMPSPTALVATRIRQATQSGEAILLDGVTMGGGPSSWAAEAHLRAGYTLYATPDAARTFNDDLEAVAKMGVTVVSDDEGRRLKDVHVITMRDFDFGVIVRALSAFGVSPRFDALIVGVFDHGAAPPDVSDRAFRFDYLASRLTEAQHASTAANGAGIDGSLAAFAFDRRDIPAAMTRLLAVAATAPDDLPLMVMDTAPAAVLGAREDPRVRQADPALVVNVGNFHTLAFHLRDGAVQGVFEHHTGMLKREGLDRWLTQLADGTISNAEVFDEHGHGAFVTGPPTPTAPALTAVIGPRRGLMQGSALHPYFAVPHGDMMLAGCFGMVRAYVVLHPEVPVRL